MEDPVSMAKAAVEGFVQDHAVRCEDGPEAHDRLTGELCGVVDELVRRLSLERPPAEPGPTCWECEACRWQLLDPQLELAAAVCLCGTGAGRWHVSTARPTGSGVRAEVAGEIRPLGREDLERVTRQLYPRSVAVRS